MAIPALDPSIQARILEVYAQTGNKTRTADALNLDRGTVIKYLKRSGLAPSSEIEDMGRRLNVEQEPPENVFDAFRRWLNAQQRSHAPVPVGRPEAGGASCGGMRGGGAQGSATGQATPVPPPPEPPPKPKNFQPRPGNVRLLEHHSDPDGVHLFGAIGDSHLGSKYERLDVLESLYDEFARAGVTRVYHTGNWIDGEATFNRYDIHTHGFHGQINYLVKHYPRRAGITTYAISGNDHEGWYSKALGIDVGIAAEQAFRNAGRDDWVHLGHIEATVALVHAGTGVRAMMNVLHPGGGSAYAYSYKPQKIVESYAGGSKPAVLLIGHYHKLSVDNIRNVWALQTGCSQDTTPFMRTKLIDAHVGGLIVRAQQDPRTGAITRLTPDMIRYFDRGYYNDRWPVAGDAVLPDRTIGQ